jgi:putative ABC transport system permease protein
MTRRPPPAALRLLRWCLSDRAFDAIAGDLHEEFAEGRSAAWYWRFALRSIAAHFVAAVPGAARTLTSSARQLRRRPLYAAGVAGTLALAVATGTASVAVVKRGLLDPLPYPHADRLVSILTSMEGQRSAVSAAVFTELLEATSPFELFAPLRPQSPALRTAETTTMVPGLQVTPDYFELLGVQPRLGHLWTSAEEPVVVVSSRFFASTLAGDEQALGRPIVLGDVPRRVIGVLPEGFLPPYFPNADVWTPLDLREALAEPRARRQLTLLARRAGNQPPEAAQAFLDPFTANLRARWPAEHGRQSWVALPLRDEMIGAARPALIGIAAGALVLWLIVCANIGGLSATRAMTLQSQLAIRQAMGASRARLIGEQLADSVCLAAVGTAAGLSLAPILVGLAQLNQRQFLDRLPPLTLDVTSLAVGAAAGLLAGVLAAFVPSRLFSQARLDDMLRSARGTIGSRRVTVTRHALIVAQVAFALVLLIGAGLLTRTVRHLMNLSPGFTTTGMTSVAVTMPGSRFATQAQQLAFEDAMLERFRQLPGVVSATASIGLAATPAMGATLHIQGRSSAGGLTEVGYTSMTPGSLEQLGLPIEAGRDLAATDIAGTTGAILINRSLAQAMWPDGSAIGARVYLGPRPPGPNDWMQIVGIVGDVRASLLAPDIRPTAYGSTRQYSWPRRHFTLHAPTEPPTLQADIRAAVRAVDPMVTVGAIQDLDEVFASQRARHGLVLQVMSVFAVVSLVLCATGLYAVVALTSQLRRREYVIRLALGAPVQDVRWRVVRQALQLAAAGIALGIAIAALGVRAIEGLLHGVAARDARTYALSAVVLVLVAAVAAWRPARAAARVSASEALKADA